MSWRNALTVVLMIVHERRLTRRVRKRLGSKVTQYLWNMSMKQHPPGAQTALALPSYIIGHSNNVADQCPATSRLIRLPEVQALCGLARSTIYRDIRNDK